MAYDDQVRWNADGLVPAIAQDAASGRVLTLAWMNREALERTASTGEAHYWSRSRSKLWRSSLNRARPFLDGFPAAFSVAACRAR